MIDRYYDSGELVYSDALSEAIRAADAVICLDMVGAGLDRLQDDNPQVQGVQQALEDAHVGGAKFVLLSDNLPVDAARFTEADAIVCAYLSAGFGVDPTARTSGSENVGVQYSLPDSRLNAGRDLEGIRRCVLDAAFQAQGKGCAPGVFGVAVGGDRLGGYEEAKRQLLRRIGERNADASLAALEERLLAEINGLGIGPMGLGGRTTALEAFIGCRNRHPASYFVTVCYNCWCCRRQTAVLNNVL